jgi:hypothetical protein
LNDQSLGRYGTKKKNSIIFRKFFGVLVAARMMEKTCRIAQLFFKDLVKKKSYPCKASTFLHLQKKFKKLTIKIDIIGTCMNFQLPIAGTLVL